MQLTASPQFYRIQLVARGKGRAVVYCIFNRWGRVGEYGQAKVLNHADLDEARRDFHKKFKDKSGLAWEERDQAPRKGTSSVVHPRRRIAADPSSQANTRSFRRATCETTTRPATTRSRRKKRTTATTKSAGRPASFPSKSSVCSRCVRDASDRHQDTNDHSAQLIFNENHFNSVLENIGYNQDKLPLGKLGESTIKNGFKALQELSSLIRHPSLAQNKYQVHQTVAIEDFTNQYYSTIPHIFGRARPPLINNVDLLQRETAMLDTLTDMEIASKIMKTTSARHADADSVNQLDQRFQQLNCDDVTPLDPTSREYRALQAYLINTAGHTHNIRYRLQSIFRVTRAGEADRFARSPFATRPDTTRRLLWHGSRTTNFAGILSQGLRIAPPEAPVNGYMFGKGVYLADISTKSANYCQAAASGGHGLLLLCEAELGNPMHDLVHADSGAAEKCVQAGKIATFGIGRTVPPGWIDAGEVHENLQGCLMVSLPLESPVGTSVLTRL